MMGEFIIYYLGKIVGGIYDDSLLVKPVKSAISNMPNAEYELPYYGAKEMSSFFYNAEELISDGIEPFKWIQIEDPQEFCSLDFIVPTRQKWQDKGIYHGDSICEQYLNGMWAEKHKGEL